MLLKNKRFILASIFISFLGIAFFGFSEQTFSSVVSVSPTKTTEYIASYELPHDSYGFTFTQPHTEDSHVFFYRELKENNWSNWQSVHFDHDHSDEDKNRVEASSLFFKANIKTIEILSTLSHPEQHIDLLAFQNTSSTVWSLPLPQSIAKKDGLIITRSEWGADDNLITEEGWSKERDKLCIKKPWYCTPSDPEAIKRLQEKQKKLEQDFPDDTALQGTIKSINEKSLLWNIQQSAKIKKLFVHHTAELNSDLNGDGVIDQKDEIIALKGMYYFHTITRGWGDIGYNYIVGPTGTIYEGRAGGDYAVGAHAVWRNISSIGVSVMGNFNSEELTPVQKQTLSSSLAYLALKYGLDPEGTSTFYGINGPMIIGHRDSDAANTACPGEKLYVFLPQLRPLVRQAMNAQLNGETFFVPGAIPTAGPVDHSSSSMGIPAQENFKQGEEKTITIQLKNTGAKAWVQGTKIKLLTATNDTFTILSGDKKQENVAVPIKTPTMPGETATFTITLRAKYKPWSGQLLFVPVANGSFEMSKFLLNVSIADGNTAYTIDDIQQETKEGLPSSMVTGKVRLKNTGTSIWTNNGSPLSLTGTQIGGNTAWGQQVGILEEAQVLPGEVGTLRYTFALPTFLGATTITLQPSIESIGIIQGNTIQLNYIVQHPKMVYEFKGTAISPKPLRTALGKELSVQIPVTNTGAIPWLHLVSLPLETKCSTAAFSIKKPLRFDRDTIRPNEIGQLTMGILPQQHDTTTCTIMLMGEELFTPFSITTSDVIVVPNTKTMPLEFGAKLQTITELYRKSLPILPVKENEQTLPPSSTSNVQPVLSTSSISPQLRSSVAERLQKTIRVLLRGTPTVFSMVTYDSEYVLKTDISTISLPIGSQLSLQSTEGENVLISGLEQGSIESKRVIFESKDGNGKIQISNWIRGTTTSTMNDNIFRQHLEIWNEKGTLQAMNVLQLKNYMAGLAEQPSTEPWEKQKALVLIARTYALYYMDPANRKPNNPGTYDITDDPDEYQRYRGYAFEKRNSVWQKALAETEGEVLFYKGQLRKTPYFSESDGRTKNAKDIWGWADADYLISQDDTWCKQGKGTLKGHGVGLSGCGSAEMANQGKTYKEILNYYYNNLLNIEKF